MILYPGGKVNILLIDFVFFENVISVTFHTLTALKMFVEVTLTYTLKLASVTLCVMFVVKHIRIILIWICLFIRNMFFTNWQTVF